MIGGGLALSLMHGAMESVKFKAILIGLYAFSVLSRADLRFCFVPISNCKDRPALR
jgi:hypothetical protein